jgi:uncharacterized RDD family membrane protein YckC
MCLWCGYQVNPPVAESETGSEKTNHPPESTETGTLPAAAPPVEEEPPEWRRELSQRLHTIKQKRDASGDLEPEPSEPQASSNSEPSPAASAPLAPERSASPSPDTRETIDSRAPAQARPPEIPTSEIGSFIKSGGVFEYDEGPMILLARTLSGVVDLIIIFLTTGALILAADIFSGVRIVDLVSVLYYTILFLLVYFLYSLFFFVVSGQTIGMMMTGLRLVAGKNDTRPRVTHILLRSFGYLISVLCLGAGLIWALFDHERRCFHDRLTDTRVVRV